MNKWTKCLYIFVLALALSACNTGNANIEEQTADKETEETVATVLEENLPKSENGFVDRNFEESIYECIRQLKKDGDKEAGLDTIVAIRIDEGELEVDTITDYSIAVDLISEELVSLEDLMLFPNLKEINFRDMSILYATPMFVKEQPIETIKLSRINFGLEDENLLHLFFENTSPSEIKLFRVGNFDFKWINDLSKVDDIFFVMDEVENIHLIDECKKLRECHLGVDTPVKLEWFSDKVELERLGIDKTIDNKFDLMMIKDLVNLEDLSIYSSRVLNHDYLKNLTKLKRIELNFTGIEGEFFISSLTELSDFSVCDNQITVIDRFPSNEYYEINVSHNQLENLDCLADVKVVDLLELGGHSVLDWSGLKSLKNVRRLWIDNALNFDFENIAHINGVRSLKLRNSEVTNLNLISRLTDLEDLDLSNNGLTKLPDLSQLVLLEELEIGGNQITDIDALKDMQNLKVVELSGTPLEGQINVEDYHFEIIFESKDEQ